MDHVATVAVVTASISAVVAVLAVWIQVRAQPSARYGNWRTADADELVLVPKIDTATTNELGSDDHR